MNKHEVGNQLFEIFEKYLDGFINIEEMEDEMQRARALYNPEHHKESYRELTRHELRVLMEHEQKCIKKYGEIYSFDMAYKSCLKFIKYYETYEALPDGDR